MKRTASILAVVLVLAIATGCQSVVMRRQPKLRDVTVEPASFEPGSTGVITVRCLDRHRIVTRVVGVVQEDPRMKFRLHDDGVAPDKTAGDGVWSLQVDVPFMAPPGDYTLEVTAYRADGEAVRVKNADGETVPLQATGAFVIRYPEEQ